MNKIVYIGILILILILAAFIFFTKNFGDIRPAILPSNKPATQNIITSTNFSKNFFVQNLGAVRDLEFSPEGTLIASITANGKIVALPDKNNDGKADFVKEMLTGLNNPHGIAFYNNKLYVAEETKLSRYNWDEQNLKLAFDKVLFNLPVKGNHYTRSLVFDADGKLYVSIGSTCNVCVEPNTWYAAIIATDFDGNNPQVFASGLRNSVFMALNPKTNEVWATDMGRDFLGDDLPPDEINIIRQGKNYGWPNCYSDKIVDLNFNSKAVANTCDQTEPPIFKIQAHSAPLGLAFINSSQFPTDWQGDLLVAYHGSWNRTVPTGYKVVHMKISDNQIIKSEDFLTGFLEGSQANGRPVDLIFDKSGNLYISDDKSGIIYIVSGK